jgi:4-amino-4-deoxy-L-arabinose transferase-like glycosyltransferase
VRPDGGPTGPRPWILWLFVLLVLLEIPGTPLFDQDETRYAEVGREMLATGDWVTPRLNGAVYLEKPPLHPWMVAASLAAFGNHPYPARIPARVSSLGTALLLILLAGGLGPAGTGPWAALIWLSAPLSFAMARLNLTDGPLTLAVTATYLLLWRFLERRERGERAHACLLAAGAAAGLAVLAKGLIGVVLPGLVLLAWCALAGKWRRLLEALLSPAPLAFAAVVVPWFLLAESANPGFTRYFVLEEHFSRFLGGDAARAFVPGTATGGDSARDHFFGYVGVVALGGFLPWSFGLVGAARSLFPFRVARLREDPAGLFLWLWFLVTPLFFAFSKSTLIPYALPALPAAALLVGRAAAVGDGTRAFPTGRKGIQAAAAALAAVFLCGSCFLATGDAFRTWNRLAVRAAGEAGATVVTYRCHAYSFPLLLERPVPVVAHRGEMGTDGALPPEIFWSGKEFWRRWDSGERIVALVRASDLDDFRKPGRAPPRILASKDYRALVANYPEGPR